jgi:hypothetical protein
VLILKTTLHVFSRLAPYLLFLQTAHEKYLLEQEQIANELQKIAIMSNFTLDEPLTGTRLPPKMNASLSDFPEYDKLTNHTARK